MTRNPLSDNDTVHAPFFNGTLNAANLELIKSGCVPSVGGGNWDVDIASGAAIVGQSTGEVSVSPQTVTVNDNSGLSSGETRVDLVSIDTGGSASVTTGAAATNPASPDIPSDEVLVAAVVVQNGDSQLSSSSIHDYRVLFGPTAYPFGSDDIGQILDVQQFTSSGTWNKPTNADLVIVDLVGAGGGGGYSEASAGESNGGGGGQREIRVLQANDLSSSESVTVGAGGSGGDASSTTAATDGGASSFAGLTASGGRAGDSQSGDGGDGGGYKSSPGSGTARGLAPGRGGTSQGAGGAAEFGGGGGGSDVGDGGDSAYGGGGGGGGGGAGGTGGQRELSALAPGDGGSGGGDNGTAPGGGGGGGYGGGYDDDGGDGARGEVRIWSL